MTKNTEILDSFDINSIPNLDIVVLGALELFQQKQLPKIDVSAYKHPLIVGSGNAEATGRIIFEKVDAVFASESNFDVKLKNISAIDGVVIISASGEKHAPIIAAAARDAGKPVTLITNSSNSSTSKLFVNGQNYSEFVFPKNREPYTYNTSTYMGMVIGATHEDPAKIESFIYETINKLQLPDFSKYDKFFLIVPTRFSGVIRMLGVKFIELFGRKIARDIETSEYIPHATTVVPSDELFISFGEENTTWGQPESRLFIPLPENADYAAMMAIGYYMVGQIQKSQPDYFKENIEKWACDVSKVFGQTISPIVEK